MPPEDTVLARVLADDSVRLMLREGYPVTAEALEGLKLATGEEAARVAGLLTGH